MYAFEIALPYLLHLAGNAGAIFAVAAILGIAFWLGDHLFMGVIPKDFKQVPIVRRAAFIGGVALAFAILWNAAFHAGGIEVSFLAPFGEQEADLALFWTTLIQTLGWMSPVAAFHGYTPAKLAYVVALGGAFVAVIMARLYWRGALAARAAFTGLFVTFATAVAIVYVAVAAVWLLQLLNIWFIALAGILFQKYRNLQLAHGHRA